MVKIGITLRMIQEKHYRETRDALSHDWIVYLDTLGVIPVLIPNAMKDPVDYFISQQCNILMLTNGDHVELKKEQQEFKGTIRDLTEAKLLAHAVENDVPVIGVCRGMQFINKFFGGNLAFIDDHVSVRHRVRIVEKYYEKILGTRSFLTNSYHTMGVPLKHLASELSAWAVKDTTVEGLYHKNHPIIAIQWHPERRGASLEIDRKIFTMIVQQETSS